MVRIKIALFIITAATSITTVLFGLVVIGKSKEVADFTQKEDVWFCGTSNYGPGEFSKNMIFEGNCKTCHRIAKKLVGPALRNVMLRRDSLWVVKFIRNGQKMKAYGDSLALALDEEYNHTQHTSFESMSDSTMHELMVYLSLLSKEY